MKTKTELNPTETRATIKLGIDVLLFKGLHRWLLANGVNCDSPLHIFRKEDGSTIYELTDSYDRAADFLRNDPRIAREHYVGSRRRLEIQVPGLDDAA